MSKEFGNSFMLYKAKNSGDGAASQWSLGSAKDCVFLEMANQNGKHTDGNAKFNWEKKIRFKLGTSDIGEILAVLCGTQDAVGPFDKAKDGHKGLFHSNSSGNAILYLGKDKNNRLQIYLSVKKDDERTVVKHAITSGEACVLGTLLRRAVEIIYKWD